jgi:hypothetical protein
MSANVVKFPFSVSRRAHARKPRTSKNGTPEERATARELVAVDAQIDNRRPAKSVSATAKNGRLRKKRDENWRMAEAATNYWRRWLDFGAAASRAMRTGAPEGRLHRVEPDDDRLATVVKWRAALVRQLLTPAPDAASVKWKQATFAMGQHRHTDVKPERIERAIADDLAFLAAHPVRQSNRRRQS